MQGPEVLEHGIGPLGRGPHGGQQVVAGLLVRGRGGVLCGGQHADPHALVPLVGQDRHPRPGRPAQGRRHVEPGRGRVVGGAGLHRTGAHGEPGESPSPPARRPRRPRPCPNTTGDGPCPGCAGRPCRCGSGSRLGSRSVLWTGAAAEGPREGPGPGRRSPPGPRIAAILQSHFVRRYGNLLLLMKVSNALRVSSKWARCRLLMDFLPSPQTRSMGFLLGL